MPIYEYKCESCNNVFECKFSIKSDSATTICTKCKGIGKKIPSLAAFHLKGKGWYKEPPAK